MPIQNDANHWVPGIVKSGVSYRGWRGGENTKSVVGVPQADGACASAFFCILPLENPIRVDR
jgi:hypothetical protein